MARQATVSARLAAVLLAAVAAGAAATVMSLVGWWRAARLPPIAELDAAARQALVEELIDRSPGVHRWAYFEPSIAYTLFPGRETSAWGDTFTPNELGYRTGPVAKQPGSFRVVFVGDSWTYGMGVRQDETFAAVVAALANRYGAVGRPVEPWVLAMPSYNLFNALAALDYFFPRLQPDAVVLCPSSNDNFSSLAVLPNGSKVGRVATVDDFGDPLYVSYPGRIDSYRFEERWRRSFDAVHAAELRLARQGVPLVLVFIARWSPAEAHAMVGGSAIAAPYVVVPTRLTHGRWRTEAWGHGTAAAHRLYGEIVYRGVSRRLGWGELPAEARQTEAATDQLFDHPPPGVDWLARERRVRARWTAENIPDHFRPGDRAAELQAIGDLEWRDGTLGRSAMVLVRATPGARAVAVSVRRHPDAAHLYPLALELSIPSPSGGTRLRSVVPAEGDEPLRVELPIPTDLRPGAALDLTLVAERTTVAPSGLAARSLLLVAVDIVE